MSRPLEGLLARGQEPHRRTLAQRVGHRLGDDQVSQVHRVERAPKQGVHARQDDAPVVSGGQLLARPDACG